jgi:hypothetical protein
MRLRSVVAVGALTTAVVTGLAPATASADVTSAGDPAPTAALASTVVVAHGGEAYVPLTYTCTNDADHPINHLFVAVKQGPRVNTTDRSGSSFATTFYSTNWSADQGADQLTCDGTSHTQTLVLKNDPSWARSSTAPPLRSGPAFLQICLFDDASAFGDEGPVDGGFVFNYTMQRVVALGGRS